MTCELCDTDGGTLLWRDERLRIIRIDDADYPMFCRVVWNAHVREMTDLSEPQRQHLMGAVFALEQALRNRLNPAKINLASFGNQTPHLHWHVIPRFQGDRHFPQPVWAQEVRVDGQRQPPRVSDEMLKVELAKVFASALQPG
jgi:diadenosine tetraphosphate (Ap4A) HIT family hydrolase